MSLYRIRNFIVMALIVIAGFILQCTVISRIPFLDCSPNLILIFTFIYGYKNGKTVGMVTGFLGGLLIDIFFCDVIGYNALILVIIGFISGIWNSIFYSDDLYVPLLLMMGSDLLYCIAYYVFWFLLRARFHFGYSMMHIILPEFILTLIAGAILYKPISALIERLARIPEQ